jgi:glucose/arabinose dehydrogenase
MKQPTRGRWMMMLGLAGLALGGRAAATGWPALTLTPIATGLEAPAHITHAGDGSGRLFIVEQRGRIRIWRNGALEPVPFLTITNRVLYGGERGLLAVAFPPGFADKQYFYVHYTRTNGGPGVVARFFVSAGDPDVAEADSEERLLTVPQPYSNHNGGQLAFSPVDGHLYLALGDGGSGNDPLNAGQNPTNLLGKILRLEVEPANGAAYAVPADNPFAGNPAYRPEIWALGLRNPWRFSFDRLTGDLFIADVGQGEWEEINFQPAASAGGENYGWRILEGTHCTGLDPCVTNGLTMPVREYDHTLGCSVTGGEVYRGKVWAPLYGTYLYADYCSGRIWGLQDAGGVWTNRQLTNAPFNITTFGSDEYGELYVSDYNGGRVLRIDETYADADADGLPDPWEAFYGFSTNGPPAPGADADEDGLTDAEEYRAGTDPRDPLSVLKFTAPQVDAGGMLALAWDGRPGRSYRVEYSENQLESFGVLVSNVAAPSLQNVLVDGGPTGSAFRAYRIVLESWP